MPKTAGVVPSKILKEIKKEIVSKFPEMKGVRPTVVRRKVPSEGKLIDLILRIDGELGDKLKGMKTVVHAREIYCASFEKTVTTERGTAIRKVVRVTFDREGRILKLVSSK
ncbi:MAG: hypothetical protein V2A71_09805 [Candidatus Eisenbacteria bacterium]